MRAVRRVVGTVCPLARPLPGGEWALLPADVDTDQIMPKQFLKRIERTGYGSLVFHSWRYDAEGRPVPDFALNRTECRGASILLTGPNFGCGSSREHAVWGLDEAGFGAIVAPSFADIFRTNCAKVGVLTVTLTEAEVRRLLDLVTADPAVEVSVDLEPQTVTAPGFAASFDVEPHAKRRLLEGLDDVGTTLQREELITAFETARPRWLPEIG